MKVAFVCSPFQGKQENVEKAKKYCRTLVDMGYVPIAPSRLLQPIHGRYQSRRSKKSFEDEQRALDLRR